MLRWVRCTAVQLHAGLAIVWGLLLIPTLLLWRESIVWIVFMSWYANFVGELSAYQAARAEEETVSNEQHEALLARFAIIERKLDQLPGRLTRLP